jgi:DNA-directed RNA polymerase specialized sigma24 family protein
MGRPKKEVSEIDLGMAIDYESGMSMLAIAKKVGMSETGVRNAILRCGVQLRSEGGWSKKADDLDRKIAEAYAGGLTFDEVMAKFSISQDKLQAALRRCEVVSRSKGKKRETNDLDRQIVTSYDSGMTYKEVAEKFGVSVCRVQIAMRKCASQARPTSETLRKVGKDVEQRMREEYEAGKGSTVLGEMFGVAPVTALACVRRAGGEIRPRSCSRRSISDEEEAKIAILYLESPRRFEDIASDFGVSRMVIRGALTRWGIEAVSGGTWLRALSPEEEVELSCAYLDGSGQIVLARKYGISQEAVRSALRRQGVQQRTQEEVNAPSIDVEEAFRLYVEEYLTTEEIGRRLGCSQTVAWKHIERLGAEPNHASKYRSTNRHFFSYVNPVNSYFAGFMAADWNVPQDQRSTVTGLAEKDVEWLEQFKRMAKLPQPVVHYVTNLGHAAVRLLVCSTQWALDLEKNFGIVPNKCFVLQPPPFSIGLSNDNACIWAFIRGYFDGDGSADKEGEYMQITSGSKPFVGWIIRDVMQSHHAISPLNGSWGCSVCGEVFRRVVPLMYAGSTPDTRLARKYDRLRHLLP